MLKDEWYPSRLNEGNGPELCGFPGADNEGRQVEMWAVCSAVTAAVTGVPNFSRAN